MFFLIRRFFFVGLVSFIGFVVFGCVFLGIGLVKVVFELLFYLLMYWVMFEEWFLILVI